MDQISKFKFLFFVLRTVYTVQPILFQDNATVSATVHDDNDNIQLNQHTKINKTSAIDNEILVAFYFEDDSEAVLKNISVCPNPSRLMTFGYGQVGRQENSFFFWSTRSFHVGLKCLSRSVRDSLKFDLSFSSPLLQGLSPRRRPHSMFFLC